MTDIERLEERFEMQLNLIKGSFNRLLEVLAEKKIITYEDSKQIVYGKNMLAMMDAMERMNIDIDKLLNRENDDEIDN